MASELSTPLCLGVHQYLSGPEGTAFTMAWNRNEETNGDGLGLGFLFWRPKTGAAVTLADVQHATRNGLGRDMLETQYDEKRAAGKSVAEARGLTVGAKVRRLSCSVELAHFQAHEKAVSPRRAVSSASSTRSKGTLVRWVSKSWRGRRSRRETPGRRGCVETPMGTCTSRTYGIRVCDTRKTDRASATDPNAQR